MSRSTRKTHRKSPEPGPGEVDGRISIRLEIPLAERFEKVVKASKRSKTSIIEECLEKGLPELERAIAA